MRALKVIILAAGLVACAALALKAEPPRKEAPAKPAKKEKEPRNLIPNGGFEEGTGDTPTGWQQIDGLTTFWVKDTDPKRGKVIKFDTDVLQSQGYEWWAKIARGMARAKDAPVKIPTKGDKYDTLAGNDGVWYWSDFIPIEKGKAYWLTIDVKGPPIMAWLVGYNKKESNAFGADANAFQEYLRDKIAGKPRPNKRGFDGFINTYSYRGQLNPRYAKPLENGWVRYTRDKMPFRPTSKHTPRVRFVRVLIFPFWPPGIYYVDNVRLTEVEDKPARK
jgi:hypothetical protein